MTTSGSTNWTIDRNSIITAALRKLRVVDASGTAPAADITYGAEALNMMVKSWQLEGVGLWLIQEAVLHLSYAGQSYTLGPSGNNFCAASDAVKTQLAADSAATDTTLTVDSITGITNGDYIGIELDDGTLEWTTVNGAPSGTTVTITTGVTSAASTDNYVFAYTTKLARPLEVLEARLRDVDDNDTPINIERSTDMFFQKHTDKTATGDCQDMLIVPHITNITAYTWPVADDVTDRIYMTIKRTIEDFDASTDNADMPIEGLEALVWGLALRLAPEYMGAIPQDIKAMAVYSWEALKAKYEDRNPVQFRPPSYLRWR